MVNRINEVITTSDGNKYMILHQAIYNNVNYYVCCGVDSETDDLDDRFYLFEEKKETGKLTISLVNDEKKAKFILKHLDLIEEDD